MAEYKDRFKYVSLIFYVIFTILCLIFVFLDFTIKSNNKIRIIINSVVLILLVSEEVIFILMVKFEILNFLYLLNIFIFIIEISLELYLQEYLPNDVTLKEGKRLYDLLTAIFFITLLICYLIFISFEDQKETDPYLTIVIFFKCILLFQK